MHKTNIKVSFVIVNYHVKRDLFTLLDSIKKSKIHVPNEIVLVDNDEKKTIEKDLHKQYPSVKYIKPYKNVGFGPGNNLGAKASSGKYIFFLNPDTIIEKGTVDTLVNFLEKNKKTAIVAPLLFDNAKNPYPLQGSLTLTPLRALFSLSLISKMFPKNNIRKEFWLMKEKKISPTPVDVVPGSAFMIRAEILRKVGFFDERYFLFFEENDICFKVKKIGYKIFIIPGSRVIHLWGKSTNESKDNILKIFQESRFYYFRKHFGFIPAIITEGILRINKYHILLFLVFLLALFLRVYKIGQNFTFDSEVSDNLLDIKNAFVGKYIPLIGPPTSHPWLYFGPLFYWIYGPILVLSHFNPISHAYFGVFISLLIIIFNYFFIKKIFSPFVAIVSAYLIAISPLFVYAANLARFMYMVPLFVYPFLYFLYKIASGQKKYLFILLFIYGCMFSFHYTPLFLFPLVISLFVIKKIKLSKREIVNSMIGFIIPLIPITIFDSQDKFSMLTNLALWIPYRILGFLGIYHKNSLSLQVANENSVSFIKFFSFSFNASKTHAYGSYTVLGVSISILLGIYLIAKIKNFLKTKHIPLNWLVFLIWGFWAVLALFIHGDAPLHYFVPLFPFPIILFTLFLQDLKSKNSKFILLISIFLIIITIANLSFFFSKIWFYIHDNQLTGYQQTRDVSRFIVQNAQKQKFMIKRIGFNDTFKGNFAQNYIYMLWLYGNEPINKANLIYTIVEDKKRVPKTLEKNTIMFKIDNVLVFKSK